MKLIKEMVIQNQYLNLPVKASAPKLKMSFIIEEKMIRWFEINLADGKPDFWTFSDVGKFKGRRLTIQIDDQDIPVSILEFITQSDTLKDGKNLYKEKYRPQFHFSSRRGWLNDPNGLVYYKGEYHLFYQHNPYGVKQELPPLDPMPHWGHAVSTNLVHWEELSDALEPDELGSIASGSAVVDWDNTAGFQTGDEKVIVAIYTNWTAPCTQSIAYSNDRGRTWTKYEKNPVLPNIVGRNRDPKVFWHKPSQKWVMALYLEKNDYGLFSSPDLKHWEQMSKIKFPGTHECPDIFELPVDGDSGNTKWIFWGGNGSYLLGTFDGHTFLPERDVLRLDWGSDGYAAQTWNDIPSEDGRRIQISCLRWGNMPNMPFNKQMTFPCELTLRTTQDGIRLFRTPVKELEKLRDISAGGHKEYMWWDVDLSPSENLFENGIYGDLFDIHVEFQIGDATEFGFIVRGIRVVYDFEKQELTCQDKCAHLAPIEGKIRLQLLVDRASIEIFGNDGRVAIPIGVIPEDNNKSLEVYCKGGRTHINALEVYELCSAWLPSTLGD